MLCFQSLRNEFGKEAWSPEPRTPSDRSSCRCISPPSPYLDRRSPPCSLSFLSPQLRAFPVHHLVIASEGPHLQVSLGGRIDFPHRGKTGISTLHHELRVRNDHALTPRRSFLIQPIDIFFSRPPLCNGFLTPAAGCPHRPGHDLESRFALQGLQSLRPHRLTVQSRSFLFARQQTCRTRPTTTIVVTTANPNLMVYSPLPGCGRASLLRQLLAVRYPYGVRHPRVGNPQHLATQIHLLETCISEVSGAN